MNKIMTSFMDVLNDENYLIFSLPMSNLLSISRGRIIGTDLELNLKNRRSIIAVEDKQSVESIFEEINQDHFTEIINEHTIIPNLNRLLTQSYSYNKCAFAISKGYQEKIKSFFKNNIESIEECFNEKDLKIKESKAKKIRDLMDYEGVAFTDKNNKDEFNNVTGLFMLINHCYEIKEHIKHTSDNNVYKKYSFEDLDLYLLAYDAETPLDIASNFRHFHVKKLLEICDNSNTKSFKREVVAQHLRQFDNLSFLEKHAPKIIGQEKTDELIRISLSKLFLKEYVEGKPNLLIDLLKNFKDLNLFDWFLTSKLENMKPNQKMLFLKILNLDYKRFEPIFKQYNLIQENNIKRKVFEVSEYELDIVNLMSKNIDLNDYKEKILYTIELFDKIFDFQDVRRKIIEEKNLLTLQFFYTPEQKEKYESKEKFLMNEFMNNSADYLSKINKQSLDLIAREILLKYELSKGEDKKEIRTRKKL